MGTALLITALLYTSRSTAVPAEIAAQVQDILAVARPRNLSLGVTGALLADAGRFAQVLEGSQANIDVLMDYIRRDPRHTDISIAHVEERSARRFANWSMAHVPPSRAIDDLLEALTADRGASEALASNFIAALQQSTSALLRL